MYEYPFGNGQHLNLDWFLSEWKNLLAAWEAEKNGIEGALQAEIDKAEAALADVFAARDAAAQSAANALESKNVAAQSASDASGYLATVRADANTASNAAQNAAQSESNAAESAQTALASKNTAGQSERNAAQSEANALANKDAAAQSAADALAHKDAAAQSAANALESKNAAAQSAEDASDAAASVESSAQQIATNTSDISNLKESIKNLDNKAPVIVETTSGSLVHITNGADGMPVKALTIDGVETASVTRTGKNLLPSINNTQTINGITWTKNADGSVTLNGTASGNSVYDFGRNSLILKAGTYTTKEQTSSDIIITLFHIVNGTVSVLLEGGGTFTLTQDEQIFLRYLIASGKTVSKTIYPQIELGTSPTSFESYQVKTFAYPSDLVQTIYGVNNIWSNEGIVNITYCADTKLYTNGKIAELQALVLENIGG